VTVTEQHSTWTTQYLEKIRKMFQNTDSHFIQVFHKTTEHWNKVFGSQVLTKDHSQLMDA
jgi:hypothetical protein